MTPLLVALGAALGGAVRHAVTVALDGRWPLGTLLANVVGSAVLGLSAALALDDHAWAFLAVGFCGAFTTFSSFAVQAVDRPPAPGAAYVAATVAGSLGACAAGGWIGTLWGGGDRCRTSPSRARAGAGRRGRSGGRPRGPR